VLVRRKAGLQRAAHYCRHSRSLGQQCASHARSAKLVGGIAETSEGQCRYLLQLHGDSAQQLPPLALYKRRLLRLHHPPAQPRDEGGWVRGVGRRLWHLCCSRATTCCRHVVTRQCLGVRGVWSKYTAGMVRGGGPGRVGGASHAPAPLDADWPAPQAPAENRVSAAEHAQAAFSLTKHFGAIG
jgi:hypothetical protein